MSEIIDKAQVICMIGTDHALAPADVRSAFSLPVEVREAVLSLARAKLEASGVVLLSTCNRTELYVSYDGAVAPSRCVDECGVPTPDDPLLRVICDMHMVDPAQYARYFACRSGEDAVSHLFHVACGLRSAIVAEDQIVSQVKQAIAYSREIEVADSVLEVLFRQAVTSAKQVKSGVRFTRAYATAVDQAVALMEGRGIDLAGCTCMVIGNGEYGRLAASTLAGRGAEVLVTVRQYTHGAVTVPRGCTGVPYDDRYSYLDRCQVVMSATTSPHYTLTRELFDEAHDAARPLLLFDLAVPSDIDPAIADASSCERFDIDSFGTRIGDENKQAIVAARRMLSAGVGDFWDWIYRRETVAHEHPPMGALFPLFFDISDKKAVFVGGGTVAMRRVRALLPFVNDITVYAPEFSPELERFADDGAVTLVQRAYVPEVLDGADFVFACTNDRAINEEVWAECRRRHVLVNVRGDRYKCDFHFPGVAVHENMVVGISAGGRDYRRVKQLRARIERLMEEEDV